MLLDNTNSTFDARLHCVRIAGDNLQGNIMKMTKSFHFSTDKFFGAIDTEKFRHALGNSEVVSEQINGIRTCFGIKSNDVLRAFVDHNQKILLTIKTKGGSIGPIHTQIGTGFAGPQSIGQFFSKEHFRMRQQSRLQISAVTSSSAEIRFGVTCTTECSNKTDSRHFKVRRGERRQYRLPLLSRRWFPKRFAYTPRSPGFVPRTILIVEGHTFCTFTAWATLTQLHTVLRLYAGRART